MDIGNLVVDLASLVIITSVFTIAVVRNEARASKKRQLATNHIADRGYYGSNPAEYEDDNHEL